MASDVISKVISRVTGRVRMWRVLSVLARLGLCCAGVALVLLIVHAFMPLPALVLWAPAVVFAAAFLAWAGAAAASVNRYEVAKRIDDELGLKDRLTSALYFERLDAHDGLTDAAIEDACRVAAQLETAKVQAGGWHKTTLPFLGVLIATVIAAIGPDTLRDFFKRGAQERDTQVAAAEEGPQEETQPTELPESDAGMKKIERRDTMTGMTRLEQEEPPPRDPSTMSTEMDPDLLAEIQNIKAALDLKDLEDMRKDFEDQKNKKERSGPEEEEKPVRMAPLDKELLDDIAAGEKKKMEKGAQGEDDAIGIAVREPSTPGAKQKGPRTKAGGQHGGGDVGESGDTRSAPKRVSIAGRDKLVIDSRKSPDLIEKTDMERVVMNEAMMVLSMQDVKITGTAQDVNAEMKAGAREPVVEESVPLGLRGYVQRYFDRIGARGAAPSAEAPADETPRSEVTP